MSKYSQAKGLIFNVVHSSFVDGWGIRTTIFLKGCPLRCLWCCNPEGQKMPPELKVIYEDCIGCGQCVSACPKGALAMADGVLQVDRKLCDGCGDCVSSCIYDALQIWGKWYTAEEMFEEVVKDEAFYKASGGGVTIGGGEATLYPEFCLGLIELCHERGINVAIDTCGYVNTELGLEVLKQADFLLFDIKGMDDAGHRRDTGVSNELIHKNLKLLAQMGKPVIIRYPAIPEHNVDNESVEKAAEFLASLGNVKRVDIIAYHTFGQVKYLQIGMTYPLDLPPLDDENQQRVKAIFESHGLTTQLGG